MGEKFLTVYAVLDAETQRAFSSYRALLKRNGIIGTQTNDIPFHISIGSYPVDQADMLIQKMDETGRAMPRFTVRLDCLNDFGGTVLFAQPAYNQALLRLRSLFSHDYPHVFPYHAHCTLLLDNRDNVQKARQLLTEKFTPATAAVVGLELGEFFPANCIHSCAFR